MSFVADAEDFFFFFLSATVTYKHFSPKGHTISLSDYYKVSKGWGEENFHFLIIKNTNFQIFCEEYL